MMIYTELDGRVSIRWNDPDKTLSLEKRKAPRMYYIDEDEIPPPPQLGKLQEANLYVKTNAKATSRSDGCKKLNSSDLEWRVKDRAPTQEESLQAFVEKEDQILTKLDEILQELKK